MWMVIFGLLQLFPHFIIIVVKLGGGEYDSLTQWYETDILHFMNYYNCMQIYTCIEKMF